MAVAFLKRIETVGNRLPDPATLFFIGFCLVIALSYLASAFDWSVSSEVKGELRANSLVSSDGIWWLLSHMVDNFIRFPPLGIVLVGMLGIGLAERSGLLPALLGAAMQRIPAVLLTPFTILVGILSSLTLDAGYVVLPPIAAAMYLAAGRSPIAGIAAVFAGISAGFSANFTITALDPLLAGLTQAGAQIIEPGYQVATTANLWFMMVSTVVLTLTGWAVSSLWVEPTLGDSGMNTKSGIYIKYKLELNDIKGFIYSLISVLIGFILVFMAVYSPSGPLQGVGRHFPRWVEATVPLLFLFFIVPGIVYGITTGSIRSDKDIARMLGETIAGLGPYIVLAFFAAQFIEAFKYSGLGEMTAIAGGQWLAELGVPASLLLSSFILMVILANLLMGSASAKYAFLAPVFVPMLMQVGISPELTQAAYRVGDSVSNVITPLNPYMIIIVVLVQKYLKGSGLGTVVAAMLPYTLVFAVVWTGLLLLWLALGIPLGPGGGLYYPG